MRIYLIKQSGRHRLLCIRDDGSSTQSAVGAGLPHHDLAHYVVERKLGLREGFYGNIQNGLSIQQLSDKHVIPSLPREALVAEVLARTLQALDSEACRPHEFAELVRMEIGECALVETLNEACVLAMQNEFQGLLEKWKSTRETAKFELEF